MKKVLMVCLGNICRSPLAEGILAHKVKGNGLDWYVDSAGTGNWHVGNLPDPRSIKAAKNHGIDITNQRARQFKAQDLEDFDLIFAMDSSNYQNIIALAKNEVEINKVFLIRNLVSPNQNLPVPDPYYSGEEAYEEVYQLLDEACNEILKNVTKHSD
jgi:protein-tyrosine phosphatase